jgi:hypothetical protein
MFALHGFLELHRRDLPEGVSKLSFHNAMGGYWKLSTTFDYQRSNQPMKPALVGTGFLIAAFLLFRRQMPKEFNLRRAT